MKLDSFYGKAVAVLIALSAFIIPASNTTPEAENAYEQAAYQELLAAMPSAAPTEEPVPTEIPAPLDRAGSAALPTAAAAATMLPTFAPTNAPTYTLPMDTYAGGYAPDETAYYTQSDIFLPDGSTTTAECYKDPSIEAVSYTWRAYESDCHIVRIKLQPREPTAHGHVQGIRRLQHGHHIQHGARQERADRDKRRVLFSARRLGVHSKAVPDT